MPAPALLVLLAISVAPLIAPVPNRVTGPPVPQEDPQSAWLGVPDEVLTRLFTPAQVRPGVYAAHQRPEPIEVLAGVLAPPGASRADGAWTIQALDPGEAFGAEPPYDKARLVRLYDGRRPRVVRGPTVLAGERASLTLVSPYPDASLSTLLPGTLVIVHRFDRPHAR